MRALAALAVAAALSGCGGGETGILLLLDRGAIDPGRAIDHIEVHVAADRCGVWTEDSASASGVTAAVGGSLDANHPFRVLIKPSGDTAQRIIVEAVALGGVVEVGRGAFADLAFQSGAIVESRRSLDAAPDGAAYASSGECFCQDGLPPLGPSGASCTATIVAGPARTPNLTCPLAAGARIACDGQLVGETPRRTVPCYAWTDPQRTGCVAGRRVCVDSDGVLFDAQCDRDLATKLSTSAGSPDNPCAIWEREGPCRDPSLSLRERKPSPLSLALLSRGGGLYQICTKVGMTDAVWTLPFGSDLPGRTGAVALARQSANGLVRDVVARATELVGLYLDRVDNQTEIVLLIDDHLYAARVLLAPNGICQ